MNYFNFIVNFLTIFAFSWYLIVNLQWYNYKIKRVIFNHHKRAWHILYFVLPFILWINIKIEYFAPILVLYIMALYLWNKKLDRTLVYTKRVQRFFIVLTIFLSIGILFTAKIYYIFALVLALFISNIIEKIYFSFFKSKAKKRLSLMKDLKIVAITASFGKTSIKNFLYHLVKDKISTYKTPRSVNTIAGLVMDVNQELESSCKLYIAEAGARVKGDIKTIADFLNPDIVVIGSVGEQHIEYFKTLENIKNTKKELLDSKNLEIAFAHTSTEIEENEKIKLFPKDLKILSSNLDGLEFSFILEGEEEKFFAPILGSFNAINISAAILVARYLGVELKDIKKSLETLPQVEHRLQKIEAGGKLIIDDSFNGNFEGMIEAFNICKNHKGRRVVITPGLVEASEEANVKIAKSIDEIFDFVILTGELNLETFKSNIDSNKVFVLKDKTKLEETLASSTKSGDLILFANDAPNFI